MSWKQILASAASIACHAFPLSVAVFARTSLLNVSCDVSRELYKDIKS